jgi:hypothetical protein
VFSVYWTVLVCACVHACACVCVRVRVCVCVCVCVCGYRSISLFFSLFHVNSVLEPKHVFGLVLFHVLLLIEKTITTKFVKTNNKMYFNSLLFIIRLSAVGFESLAVSEKFNYIGNTSKATRQF